MNSMPQHAVTNGYRNIEYLRAQLKTASTVVVRKVSWPWRRTSTMASARALGDGASDRTTRTPCLEPRLESRLEPEVESGTRSLIRPPLIPEQYSGSGILRLFEHRSCRAQIPAPRGVRVGRA